MNNTVDKKPNGGNDKKFVINPQLRNLIKETVNNNPLFDIQKVTQIIVSSKKLRLGADVIKKGVQEYFKLNVTKENAENKNIKSTKEIDIDIDKPIKKIKKNQFVFDFQDHQSYKFKNLGGIEEIYLKIKNQIFSLVQKGQSFKQISRLSPNRGFLICGSPGSGKTFLANCILSYLIHLPNIKIKAFSVNAYEFLGGDADQKIKKVFQTAEQNSPSIIFIDNIDELCNKDNNKRMTSMPSITLSNYISKVKDKQIYLLAASSAPQKLDILTKPGMYYKQIKINNPDEEQRRQILQKLLVFYNHNIEQHIKELCIMTAGYVAVDISSLLKQAALKCVERVCSNFNKKIQERPQQMQKEAQLIINFEDLQNAFKEIQPILKKDGFAKIPNVKLQDVGALQNIKEELTQQIIMPLRERQKFKNMNFQVNGGGILLYGPPGCGKTMIAKAIANEANANFITVKGPQLLNKYVGQSEEAVRKVFQRARMSAPCIIFFDQFDALAPKRQDQGNQVTQRVVNTLLNELNGVDERRMVFVIAATNRPDIIDEAILRSGRIQKHLYVPLPNNKERLQILNKITNKVNRQQNLNLQEIAQRTQNFSGADLYFLVKKAIVAAISNNRSKINSQDLVNALSTYKQDKYNKKNGLKLSQFQQEKEESDSNFDRLNDFEEKQTSIKKSRSVMEYEVQENSLKTKQKKKVNESFAHSFVDFIDYYLQMKKTLTKKNEKQ